MHFMAVMKYEKTFWFFIYSYLKGCIVLNYCRYVKRVPFVNGTYETDTFCVKNCIQLNPKRLLWQSGIGYLGTWNNALIYLSYYQTIASKCAIPNALNNLH